MIGRFHPIIGILTSAESRLIDVQSFDIQLLIMKNAAATRCIFLKINVQLL